jgi:hypothetical protein
MDYTALITLLIQAGAQYGPALVKSIADLIHGNPQQQGETDAAYIARISAQIDAKAADTTAQDESVIQDQAATAPASAPQAETSPNAATTPGGILNVK